MDVQGFASALLGRGRPGEPVVLGIVGPSGVGKDSVIAALLRVRPQLELIERVVTRPADPTRESHASLDAAAFDRAEAEGHFALVWRAHGLAYGVPRLRDAGARIRLANLSRTVLDKADQAFPRFGVLAVDARPDVIAARLAAREGVPAAQLLERLTRSVALEFDAARLALIDNSGALEDAVAQAAALVDGLIVLLAKAGEARPEGGGSGLP